jgi:hypothetical protein
MASKVVELYSTVYGRIRGEIVEETGQDGRVYINGKVFRTYQTDFGDKETHRYWVNELLVVSFVALELYGWAHKNGKALSNLTIDDSELA